MKSPLRLCGIGFGVLSILHVLTGDPDAAVANLTLAVAFAIWVDVTKL